MSGKIDWLNRETVAWVGEGLLDEATAARIRARYAGQAGGTWLVNAITTFGAVIFGLGVILVIAYNWAAMPTAMKLAAIFAAVALTHGLGWLFTKKPSVGRRVAANAQVLPVNAIGTGGDGKRNLNEGFHMLGTMLFGAGIFLIAQIYHVDEHFPDAFLIWGLGALALAWAMPSTIQGLLAAILLTIWGATELFAFERELWRAPALILFGLATLAWYQRSAFLLFVSIGVSLWLSMMNSFFQLQEAQVLQLALIVSLGLTIAGNFWPATSFVRSKSVLLLYGVGIYGLILFSMTLDSNFVRLEPNSAGDSSSALHIALYVIPALLVLAIVVARVCGYGVQVWKELSVQMKLAELLQYLLLFATTLLVMVRWSGFVDFETVSQLALIANAILFAHGVLLMAQGVLHSSRLYLSMGTVIVLTITVLRFFNLFDSLLARSLVFLFVGGVLFFMGYRLSRMSSTTSDKHEKRNDPSANDNGNGNGNGNDNDNDNAGQDGVADA